MGSADDDVAAYVRANGRWIGDQVAARLSAADQIAWTRAFDPQNPACIYRAPDFYFCMVEVAVIRHV